MKTTTLLSATLLAATLSISAFAQTVEVKDAWARATVQGQMATGAFEAHPKRVHVWCRHRLR